MRKLRALAIRLRNLFRKRTLEHDLREELESNIQMEIDDALKSGISSEEARRRVQLKYGSLETVREESRERRGIPFIETTARDVRYSLRTLWQNRSWTSVAVLSLALGIGVNTALFSILNSVLLEKLPVAEAHELVSLRWVGETNMSTRRSGYGYLTLGGTNLPADPGFMDATFSYATFESLREQAVPQAELFAAANTAAVNVFANGQAELAQGEVVSGNFYRTLGVAAFRGRLIEPADDSLAAEPVAVISYEYWQRRFAMDPAAIGSRISINTVPFTVVGITPAEYQGVIRNSAGRDITIPVALDRRTQRQSRLDQPGAWWLVIMGRLKPGGERQQLQATLQGAYDRTIREEWKAAYASLPPERRAQPEIAHHEDRVAQLQVTDGARGVYDVVPQLLTTVGVLQGFGGLVLLLVAVNLANLLLSRGAAREREIMIRLAIGAGRRRVVRQLLTESLVLAAFGGGIGLALAYGLRSAFPVWLGLRPVELDGVVVAFAVAATTITAIAFALLPAFRATRLRPADARLSRPRMSRSATRMGKSLAIAQVALSLVLLVGAGLLTQTLWNLRNVNTGFNTANLVVFGLNPAANQYDAARTARLLEDVLDGLRKIPGVRSATLSSTALLTGDNSQARFGVEGRSDRIVSYVLSTDSEYFQTLEIPLKLGRQFTSQDGPAAPRVAIVNETFARTYFPGTNPIGRHVESPPGVQNEIVGVVGDARFATLRVDPPPTVYMPQLQRPTGRFFAVRTSGDAGAVIPAIRDSLRQLDPALPFQFIYTQDETIDRLLRTETAFAVSSSLFGGLALVISAIGIFGVMSYAVARRTKEIGIRMVLGAERPAVLRSIIREALVLVGVGTAIGLPSAWWLERFVAGQLFGLGLNGRITTVAAIVILIGVVAGLAAYLPARRASRVAPWAALRYE